MKVSGAQRPGEERAPHAGAVREGCVCVYVCVCLDRLDHPDGLELLLVDAFASPESGSGE